MDGRDMNSGNLLARRIELLGRRSRGRKATKQPEQKDRKRRVTLFGAIKYSALITALALGGLLANPAVAQDPPPLPVVTIEASDSDASEVDLDTGSFLFSRTGDTSGALTVMFTVNEGEGAATNGVDYASIGTSVDFAAGKSTATRVITPLCDDADEEMETVALALTGGGVDYVLGEPASATVNIADAHGVLPVVTIRATDPDASEIGPDPGRFTVTRSRCVGETADLTVQLTVTGTATPEDYELLSNIAVCDGDDANTPCGQNEDCVEHGGGPCTLRSLFTPNPATLLMPAGITSATIVLTPSRDDLIDEPLEEVVLALTGTADYDVGPALSATISIQNDPGLSVCQPERSTDSGCRNQGFVDLFSESCTWATDVCNGVVGRAIDFAEDLCNSSCNLANDAFEAFCDTAQDTCDAVNNTCTSLAESAYAACLATGVGTGCNAEDAVCRAGCAGRCTLQCAGKCLIPWRDKCKSCVSSCSSSCNGACNRDRSDCVGRECASINTGIQCIPCGNCDAAEDADCCEGRLNWKCDQCTANAEIECLDICDQAAEAFCIRDRQLGETCNWGRDICSGDLVCRPDLTGLQGLTPGSLFRALLLADDMASALENLKQASGAADFQLGELFCVNDNCTCQPPLLEIEEGDNGFEQFSAHACMALYNPLRHFQAWMINSDLNSTELVDLRNDLQDKWRERLGDDIAGNLASRYQKLAFVYGAGGYAGAGAQASAEIGTVYGPECFGCYLTVCPGAVTDDATVGLYGAGAVFDASDVPGNEVPEHAIKNLEGWSRFLQLGASIPGVEAGASIALYSRAGDAWREVPFPSVLNPEFYSNAAWQNAWNAFEDEFEGWKKAAAGDPDDLFEKLMDALLDKYIPIGAAGAVSIGVGANPVTAAGGVCYTWVTESLCLSDDDPGSGGDCLTGSIPQELAPPPEEENADLLQAFCRNTTVVARPVSCDAEVNIDAGSFSSNGNPLTIVQSPPAPYNLVGEDANGSDGIGVHHVTLTASDEPNSATAGPCTVTVLDLTPPAIDTPAADSTVECDGLGNTAAVQAWVDDQGGAEATDCSSWSWSNNDVELRDPCGAAGKATVTFTATDVAGYSSTTSATFTIQDTTAPTITCPGTIYQESPAGSCTDTVSYSVTASDDCGTTSIACVDQGGNSVGTTGDTFPVGTTTVTCTATDECGLTSQCSFDVVVNDPPQITDVSPSTPDGKGAVEVQYSDKIVPVVVTATDCGPGSSLTLDFDAADVPDGLALSDRADSCGTNDAGLVECTWTLSNDDRVLEPEGVYVIDAIKAVDPTPLNGVTLKSSPDKSITVDVKAENATIAFDGGNPVAVQVASDGGNSGTFDLTVHVQELYPEIATAGGELPGDIGLAVMSMTLAPVGPGGGAVGTCVPENDPTPLDYSGVLTVTCEFDNVEVNTYTIRAELVDNVSGELFYTGSNEDVLVVFDPSLGFTTGGGHFYWPPEPDAADNHYPGDRTNFGYTMKYNRKRTNIQGSLLLIRHLPDGRIYRVKSNALYGLALGDESSFGWASFAGKGTFKDPDMVEPEGNHEFVTYVEDLDEPGAHSDRFWLQVFDKDGVLIRESSMFETAVGKAVTIEGGNIVVPHTSRRTASR